MRILILKKSTLIRVALFVVILIGAIIYTKAVLGNDVEVYKQNVSQMPICSVSDKSNEVAITFDTTFGEDYTKDILKILKKYNVKATFAVMGVWAEQNPELTQQIVDQGNEVISHSMNHGSYINMSEKDVVADANKANEVLSQFTGQNVNLIRAPYGTYDDTVINALKENNYVPIMWSIDSMDWTCSTT